MRNYRETCISLIEVDLLDVARSSAYEVTRSSLMSNRRSLRSRCCRSYMSLLVVCSTVATVYAITSFIFLRKPHWLYQKRHPAFIVRHIAHRGGESKVWSSCIHEKC